MEIMMFAMLCIALVRCVGLVVMTDFFLRQRQMIYLWLAFGWLLYALSPVFKIFWGWNDWPGFEFLYLSLALEGMMLLVAGATGLFIKQPLKWVLFAAVVLFFVMLVMYATGWGQLLAGMVPALQFLMLAAVSSASFARRKTMVKVGGKSIYWLIAIFVAGCGQALMFIFLHPPQLSVMIYAQTVLMSVLIIIFFMHLQNNISLKREQESDSRYRLIVENQSDLIIKLDMSGRFLYANPKYCELFGTSQDTLLGTLIERHTVEAGAAEENTKHARLALFKKPFACYVEERTLTSQGWRWLAWSEKTVFDEDDNLLAVVAAGRDITPQKEAEAEIRRLNQELEQRVGERTAQLQALNKELETFTYSVSHDLKAPLRGIEGFSKILLEDHQDKLNAEGRHFLWNIVNIVGHMRALIDDLLAYSRLERRTVRNQRIMLEELVNDLLAEHRLELDERAAQVDIKLQDCVLEADQENLRQALGNLIDNAIKYSRNASPPRIEVGLECVKPWVRIWVRDNGIGFDIAFKEKIFELFQRLHGPDEYAGTGVGLAIVAKAVQRMEGKINVVSAPGQGATFTIELPAPGMTQPLG